MGRRLGMSRVATITASLVGTQAVTSVLGLVFWTLAARSTSVAAVGLAGAAVALMMVLASLGMLGLGTLLIAELPRQSPDRRRVFVRTCLATATYASVVIAVVTVAILSAAHVHGLAEVTRPFNSLDFIVGTGLTGLVMVLDQAVLVVGSGFLQLERNLVASAVKIVVLAGLTLAGHHAGMDIFLAWTVGNLVSLPVVAWRTRVGQRTSRRLVEPGLLRGVARSAGSHHLLNLVLQSPLQLLSVIVVVVLSATSNGYFSSARNITGFVFVLPYSITIGLFAAAQGDEDTVIATMRKTIPIGLAASVAADLVLFPFGHLVLGVFGGAYSHAALTTLRVLVLAGVPFVIKDHYIALRRVQGRTGRAAFVSLIGAVAELCSAVAGAEWGGTVGLCAAWVGCLAVEALFLSVPLIKQARELRLGAHDETTSASAAPAAPSRHPALV